MAESSSLALVEEIMAKARQAAAIFSQLDQEHTDRIVRAVYEAAFRNRVKLAKLAHQETGMGKWQDKVLKNVVATQFVYEDIKDLKSVGIISDDPETGIVEIAQPMGPILAIIPVTNPTSTVCFKVLIALKTRNPLIISPSRKAKQCSAEAARICYEAALGEDAPEDCIQWLPEVSREQTQALMSHKSQVPRADPGHGRHGPGAGGVQLGHAGPGRRRGQRARLHRAERGRGLRRGADLPLQDL